MRIAITGGTGFVGGHVATALSSAGHEVVVIARGEDRRPWATAVQKLPRVRTVQAGLSDQRALEDAFAGCDAVAHCAGINREIGSATFDAVHVKGTANVVRAAEHAGVRRLTLVSFLRARPRCGSPYHESKWAAEEIVRASSLDWTVLKPGMMFGRGDHMLDHLSKALLTLPIYLGIGNRPVRPLAVQDAVEVMTQALLTDRLARRTIALFGPTQVGFDEIARMVARVMRIRRVFVRAPIAFHYALAAICEALMTIPLIARAQVRILEEGLVEATLAPDVVPADMKPTTEFDETVVRAGLPVPLERFGLRDLRGLGRRADTVVCGEGRAVIRREPREIVEFVLDVERYRLADRKIGRLHWARGDGNVGEVRHGGRLLGLPMPAATLAYELSVDPGLVFRGTSVPWPIKGFDGSFETVRTEQGTEVTHRECFTFGPITGPFIKQTFGRWLKRDTRLEVQRMKRLLERER